MKIFFYILLVLVVTVFCLIKFKVIELDISKGHSDSANEINIVDGSISNTIVNFVSSDQQSLVRNKLVILNYWGMGCGPCIAEFPMLNGIAKIASSNKTISCVSVCNNANLKEIEEKKKKFDSYKFNFIPLEAKSGLGLSMLKVVARNVNFKEIDSTSQVIPTTLVYNETDSILFFKSGRLNEKDSIKLVSIIGSLNN